MPSQSDSRSDDQQREFDAIRTIRDANTETLRKVYAKLASLPAKGTYPPDQIIAILKWEFGDA